LARHHRHATSLVHKKKPKLDEVRGEINVTPLVDVCLVLLIIFMVVADKLTRGMEVPLPKARFANEKRDTGEDLIISVVKQGGNSLIYWDRALVDTPDALKARVVEEMERRGRPIFLKADSALAYSQVYPVMMAIHDGGATNVLLGTIEKKEK